MKIENVISVVCTPSTHLQSIETASEIAFGHADQGTQSPGISA